VEKGAKYAPTVKENRRGLYEQIEEYFSRVESGQPKEAVAKRNTGG
jgi:hypothetical protein